MRRITITVLENATIFEAEEQIHRYDLPLTGILAGWAVAAVVDQVKAIADGDWPEIEVAITGPDRAVDLLTRTLLNKGISAYDAEALDDKPMASEPVLQRPRKGRRKAAIALPSMFHVAVAAVILTVIGVSWWGIKEEPVEVDSVATMAPPSEPPATAMVVEYDRVRMKLPAGYQLGPREDGLLVASGADPNLRIVVAVDPVYGVDAGRVRTEIASMVAADPALVEQTNRNLRPSEPTVEYEEKPGDGSSVHWVAWVAKDHQFSVGCHSRSEESMAQRAACRMAVETLDFK